MVSQIKRMKTLSVDVGGVLIGGEAPITVQSMTSTRTEDIEATIAQIHQLEKAGCEIVRIAVPTLQAARAIKQIKKEISIPLVADIHFDFKLALEAMKYGVDKIRINPGNIGSQERIKKILGIAREREIPIRIGVNGGSLEKELIIKYKGINAKALVESAMKHVTICENFGFEKLIVSIKTSDIPLMIEANRLLSRKIRYPLHLGVTEAGIPRRGVLRSAVGIGTLLAEGIGDTIRVSLTGDPVHEVTTGFEILKSLQLRTKGLTIISCPTCGRTQTNIVELVEKIEKELQDIDKPITLAVMGCAVNGPGEAKEADIGVACGKHSALLFKKGKVIQKIPESEIVRILVDEIHRMD